MFFVLLVAVSVSDFYRVTELRYSVVRNKSVPFTFPERSKIYFKRLFQVSAINIQILLFQYFAEKLLGVWSNLSRTSCFYVLFNLLPVFAKHSKCFYEALMLIRVPSTSGSCALLVNNAINNNIVTPVFVFWRWFRHMRAIRVAHTFRRKRIIELRIVLTWR